MRPSQIKYPFTIHDKKKVILKDRILFIPQGINVDYEAFSGLNWSAEEIFGNTNPVKVEYCSGHGHWIAEKARTQPNVNWVAVEKRFDRVRCIWSKRGNLQLSNLFIVCGEAFGATSRYFPKNSVSDFFINFPDPWPKRRHAKNRLIAPPFIQEMHRCLLPEGEITLVTDDVPYSESILQDFSHFSCFRSYFPSPYFTESYPGYGTSCFEELWREQGLAIRYHRFSKVS